MSPDPAPMKKALMQLNLAVFLWGFTGVLGRLITLDPTWLVWYRLLITAVSLWVLYGFTKRIRRIPARQAVFIGCTGLVQALHWVFFYASIKYANVTIGLTCLSTSALMAAFIEPVLLRRRFDGVEILLGLFAIGGIVVIYNTHVQFSLGIVLGLISTALTVLVSVLNKKMVASYESGNIMLYQLSGGFLGLSLILPFYQHFFPEPVYRPAPMDWLWLVIMSWVCTIYTFSLYIQALRKISAFTMNLTLTLEPVYGILLAFMIFRENKELTPWFYLGFALITVAVAFQTWRLLRK